MSLGPIFVQCTIAALKIILVSVDELVQLTWVCVQKMGASDTQPTTETATATAPPSRRRTVVIVGGNFSGLAALWELLQHADRFRIVLIDQKEFFEYTPGVLRLFCQPQHFDDIAKPFPNEQSIHPKRFHRIQGKVTSLTNEHGEKVLTYDHPHLPNNRTTSSSSSSSSSSTLSYDYLILATGSTYNYPITASMNEATWHERKKGWKKASDRLKAARTILVLGGGAVGVELAADIVDFSPSKKVTLVDASPTLVPLFPKTVGNYAADWLTKHGVTLVLGKFLASWDDTSCTLRDGTILQADIVYVCFGGRPNSQCTSSLGTATSSTRMTTTTTTTTNVVVSNTLQLASGRNHQHGDIFACGDVASPPTEGNKQAFHAEMQGHLAAQNVVRRDKKQKLLTYPADIAHSVQMPLIFILSLGRFDGVLGFNELVISGSITAVLKWGLEFTKVMQMQGRVLGHVVWKLADELVLLLSRTVIKPNTKSNAVKTKIG